MDPQVTLLPHSHGLYNVKAGPRDECTGRSFRGLVLFSASLLGFASGIMIGNFCTSSATYEQLYSIITPPSVATRVTPGYASSTAIWAKKDPSAPKKPRNGYIIFASENRPRVLAKDPDLTAVGVVKELAKMWEDLPESGKAVYKAKAEDDKKRYATEMLSYTPPPPPPPPLPKGSKTEEGVDAEEGEPKKAKKAKRDPSLPKRPLSSFLLFANDARAKLKEQGVTKKPAEMMVEIGKQWKALPEKAKEKYEKMAASLKKEYDQEKAKLSL